MRGWLRDLPPRGPEGERRRHPHRPLRGRAHRIRPAPPRLGPALRAGPAGRRGLPGQPRLLLRAAVPLVHGIDGPAAAPEVLGAETQAPYPLLLLLRVLLLPAHGAVHVRHAADPADHALP